ncbi:MAG TPA: bi-domain-containing oxidoreductase [Candidatus Xenobia bacterium]|nr:bi-domain-containing oxidoreductase [Candidatus Xenobia bacterium]
MKQLTQSYRTGALSVEEVPIPALRPQGVLVRNAFSLISPGTERAMMELARASLLEKARQRPEQVRQVIRSARQEGWLTTFRKVMDRLDTPVSVGYCSAGTVIEVGSEVTEFRLGDRVACAGEGHGAHAEVVYVPRTLCARVPDNVSLEHAAMAPLGAIALESLRQANVQLGERVAVVGLGLVGLLIVQLLEAAGCHVLAADIDPERVALARTLGAENACEAAHLEAAAAGFTADHGIDVVILAAASRSADLLELAGRIARERGRVVIVGVFPLEIPRKLYFEKELSLMLSRAFGPGSFDPEVIERGRDYPYSHVRWTAGRHLEEFLAQIASGGVRVEPLLTHRFPIERAEDAYKVLDDPSARPLGIVFSYDTEKALPRSFCAVTAGAVSEPRKEGGRLSLGVIGAGKFAQTYLLPHFRHRGVKMITVCTATSPSAAHVARKFGFAQCTCDAEAVLQDPQIDCLLIATRHDLHARLAAAGLRAGKAVFVEKPLALDQAGLREVLAAARATGGKLHVGFNRRFSPLARRVKDFFAHRQGPLVMTYRVNAAPIPPDHWIYSPVEGGGRIRSEMCHFIDLLSFFAGAPPVRVHAEAVSHPAGPMRADENIHVAVQFADGSSGTITYTTIGDTTLARERVEVFGENTVAVINNFRTGQFHRGHRTRPYWYLQQDMGYRDEVKTFLEAARGARPMPIPLAEILASSLATLLVLDSLSAGHPIPVDLSALETPTE